ncbi:MAG: Rieske (2Fe-2S) protein [Myxococcales bacterium]|nr:Rieske (2Fe-2S) protein [Myxococcales bacterium]
MTKSSRAPTPSIANQVSRRRFLRNVAGGCAAVGLVGCEVSEIRTSGGSANELAFDLSESQFAALKDTGAMVAANAGKTKLLLIRSNETTMVALNRVCPHLLCEMTPGGIGEWHDKEQNLECLCHNSKFGADGKYVANSVKGGGNVDDLESYPVSFDAAAGTGVVDLGGAS